MYKKERSARIKEKEFHFQLWLPSHFKHLYREKETFKERIGMDLLNTDSYY